MCACCKLAIVILYLKKQELNGGILDFRKIYVQRYFFIYFLYHGDKYTQKSQYVM